MAEERKKLVESLLIYHKKRLDPAHMMEIVASPLSWRYSVVLVLLDELRSTGCWGPNLLAVIMGYLYNRDGSDRTPSEFYEKVTR